MDLPAAVSFGTSTSRRARTWLGRTRDGEIACFVTDQLILDDATVLD